MTLLRFAAKVTIVAAFGLGLGLAFAVDEQALIGEHHPSTVVLAPW